MDPPAARIELISPMAQLKAGRYNVPTYIVHSDADEIAPFADSKKFVEEMQRKGGRCGFGWVKGKKHIHDLALKPGDAGWINEVECGYNFLDQTLKEG